MELNGADKETTDGRQTVRKETDRQTHTQTGQTDKQTTNNVTGVGLRLQSGSPQVYQNVNDYDS